MSSFALYSLLLSISNTTASCFRSRILSYGFVPAVITLLLGIWPWSGAKGEDPPPTIPYHTHQTILTGRGQSAWFFFLFVPTAFSYKKKLVVTLPRKPPLCLTVQTETAVIYYHCTLPCVNDTAGQYLCYYSNQCGGSGTIWYGSVPYATFCCWRGSGYEFYWVSKTHFVNSQNLWLYYPISYKTCYE